MNMRFVVPRALALLTSGSALEGFWLEQPERPPANQPARPDTGQPTAKDQPPKAGEPRSEANMPIFLLGDKIRGMSVVNQQDQGLGEITDLIIERGSGRTRYLVLRSGGVLGLGGKHVTVPYDSFAWDHNRKNAVLAATPEQVKGWTEFEKSKWSEGARSSRGYIRTLGKDYYITENSPWPAEADAARTSTLTGTVQSVKRRTAGNGEELIVVVSTPDKRDREVLFGPSWYVGGNNSIALYREAPIEVVVFETTRNGQPIAVARSAKIAGRDLALYDQEGRARWVPGDADITGDPFAASPFVLASEIKGKDVTCRGESCGDVKDIVVETGSGQVAFLAIDPDAKALGIGDENRLVPWGVTTRSPDGKVHVDASKAMLSSAPTLPSDLKALSDEQFYTRICELYETEPQRFEMRQRP